MQVPTLDQFNTLLSKVERLESMINQLAKNQPNDAPIWVIQSEANKMFIGRGNKPIDRHTFLSWILQWVKDGQLVEGQNYLQTSQGRFISMDFLKANQFSNNIKKVA